MTAVLDRRYPPLYREEMIEAHRPYLARLHSPGKLPGLDVDGPLPAQAHKAAAVAALWKSGAKSAIVSGEMGVGVRHEG
jgi:hypothetical protein